MFILPLVALLIAASARPTLNKLAHWNLHHKEWVRLAPGAGVTVMGILFWQRFSSISLCLRYARAAH